MNKITAEEYKKAKEESGNREWIGNRIGEVIMDILTKTDDDGSTSGGDFIADVLMLILRANYYIMLGKGKDDESIIRTHLSDVCNVLEHIFEKDCAIDATIAIVEKNLDAMHDAYKNDEIYYDRK